jgi:hypothetical protein
MTDSSSDPRSRPEIGVEELREDMSRSDLITALEYLRFPSRVHGTTLGHTPFAIALHLILGSQNFHPSYILRQAARFGHCNRPSSTCAYVFLRGWPVDAHRQFPNID